MVFFILVKVYVFTVLYYSLTIDQPIIIYLYIISYDYIILRSYI